MLIEAEYVWLYPATMLLSAFQIFPIGLYVCKLCGTKYKLSVVLAAYCVVIGLLSFLGMMSMNQMPWFALLRGVITVCLMALFFVIVCNGTYWKNLLLFLMFYLIVGIVDAIVGLTAENLLGREFGAFAILNVQHLVTCACFAPIYWLSSYATYIVLTVKKVAFLRKRLILYCIIPFVQIEAFAVCSGYAVEADRVILLVCLGLVLVSQFFIFHSIYLAALSEKLNKEKADREMALATERSYYQNLSRSHNEIRRLRHDIRNELSAVAKLIEDPDTRDSGIQLFREVESRFDMADYTVFCDVPLINAVLHDKVQLAQQHDVELTVDIKNTVFDDCDENGNIGSVEMYDLCSALGNILDNAVKASAGAKNGRVNIKMFSEMKYLFINCENTVSDKRDDSFPSSSGLGLGILNDLAVKYDGVFSLEEKKGRYTALLSLKISEK